MIKFKDIKVFALIIIITLTVVTAFAWCVDVRVYDTVDSKDVVELLNKHKNDTLIIDGDFLRVGETTIYAKSDGFLPSFFKYSVIGVGCIYKNTEASYKIDSIFDSKKLTKRQKLHLDN